MGKRDYGTGSIYQRSDGKWVGAFDAGYTERGTRRRPTVVRDTEERVKVALRKKMAAFKDGASAVNTRTTVKTWAETWLPIVERDMRPKSYASTASAVKVWVIPTIGHKRLDDLGPADVRHVMDAMRRKGRTTSSQARVHSTVTSMLKAARAEGHAVAARVTEVKAPRPNVNDRTSIQVDEAVDMLGIAAGQDDGSRWVAAFLQGLRQSERLGLTWDQVDFENDIITISWQLQALPYRVARDRSSGFRIPDGYESRQIRDRWHLVRPKTSAGWRRVPMVPWLSTSLQAWRERAPENAHGLVWPVDVGDPQKLDDAAWYALQEEAGVTHPSGRHYTIHECRHTTATLLLEAGVEPAIIALILGQSKMLAGYIHLSTAPLAAALGKVADRLALR